MSVSTRHAVLIAALCCCGCAGKWAQYLPGRDRASSEISPHQHSAPATQPERAYDDDFRRNSPVPPPPAPPALGVSHVKRVGFIQELGNKFPLTLKKRHAASPSDCVPNSQGPQCGEKTACAETITDRPTDGCTEGCLPTHKKGGFLSQCGTRIRQLFTRRSKQTSPDCTAVPCGEAAKSTCGQLDTKDCGETVRRPTVSASCGEIGCGDAVNNRMHAANTEPATPESVDSAVVNIPDALRVMKRGAHLAGPVADTPDLTASQSAVAPNPPASVPVLSPDKQIPQPIEPPSWETLRPAAPTPPHSVPLPKPYPAGNTPTVIRNHPELPLWPRLQAKSSSSETTEVYSNISADQIVPVQVANKIRFQPAN